MPFLNTGVIIACFHSTGTAATDNSWLNSNVSGLAEQCFTFLNNTISLRAVNAESCRVDVRLRIVVEERDAGGRGTAGGPHVPAAQHSGRRGRRRRRGRRMDAGTPQAEVEVEECGGQRQDPGRAATTTAAVATQSSTDEQAWRQRQRPARQRRQRQTSSSAAVDKNCQNIHRAAGTSRRHIKSITR